MLLLGTLLAGRSFFAAKSSLCCCGGDGSMPSQRWRQAVSGWLSYFYK